MIKKLILIILVTTLGYAQQQVDIPWPTLANSDWPMIKRDPQFTGRSPYKGPQTPNIVWIVDMENGIFSGPVIGEKGNLYFGSYYTYGDYFYSYSPDGEFIWKYQTGSGRAPQSGILIDSSNIIYFGSRDSNFYALNPNGTLKWKYKTSAPITQVVIPNIDLEGNLYVTTSNQGNLYSIKPDGTLNWSVAHENGFGNKSPVFSPDGNTIYIAGRDSNLFALNLDGSLKWKFSCGAIQKAPLIDSDGNIYFIPYYPQYFFSLSPTSAINWNIPVNRLDYSIPTIDNNGNLYIIAVDSSAFPNNALMSYDFNGNFRWSYILDDYINDDFWQPLICDSEGTVYFGSTHGYNYYAISSDGKLKWKLPLTKQKQQVDNTGAIAKDGTLYLGVHDVAPLPGQQKTLIAIRDTGTVSVNEDFSQVKDYSLFQNYPNPFNPSTVIGYQLPVSGNVTLKVFDVLGREIATLVNEYKEAGKHSVEFNAAGLPSGVYFYRLNAGSFSETKKMILLR